MNRERKTATVSLRHRTAAGKFIRTDERAQPLAKAIAGHSLNTSQSNILSSVACEIHRQYNATLFCKVVSNKLRVNVKNEMTLTCAKFGADLTNIDKSQAVKQKWSCFLAIPYDVVLHASL